MVTNAIFLPILTASVNLAILLVNRVRLAIGLLAIQYVLASVISLPAQPLRSVLARLLGGLIVCLILITVERKFPKGGTFIHADALPRSLWFRMTIALIVILVAWAFANQSEGLLASVEASVLLGAVLNICMGLLMLGLYQSPLEAAIGLLTLLIGFDLFYGSIEPALTIVALMVSIHLIIALATSYIISVAHYAASMDEGRQ
ncbi:MAG: hypothetical protein E4G99_07085 [Anaerolineales bacterium]|nr:MAG: hypothetical protein E4G99_07085 [Anaerolineales bacterium]